jgi:ribonuclease T1
MKWNRTTIKAVVITFVTIIATSFFIKWTFDHDGESGTLFGDDQTSGVSTGPTSGPTVHSGEIDPVSGLPWVLEEELPVEGQGTLALIDQGGPFPFPDKDGSTFGNLERLLPEQPRGYYAEYTVITPGSTDRGARRIISGDGGEFYWTQDHYRSFERIARRLL